MAKRKIKIYGKIKLFETSAVGIAAYPDAHLSIDSFSLCKALSNAVLTGVDELNLNKEEIKMSETETDKPEIAESESTTEIKPEDKSEDEKPVEEKLEETEKNITSKDVESIVKSAIKEALKEMKPERGLIAKEKSAEEIVKSVPTGALAIEMFRQSYPQK